MRWEVSKGFGEGLGFESRILSCESVEAEGGWLRLEVEAEDALTLQWKLMQAAGPFLVPGRSVLSCTVVARYRVLVQGAVGKLSPEGGGLLEEIAKETETECSLRQLTLISSGWAELFVEADIPNAHQLHKWVVDLEGANLAGFRMAAVALANPLEVSRLPPH